LPVDDLVEMEREKQDDSAGNADFENLGAPTNKRYFATGTNLIVP